MLNCTHKQILSHVSKPIFRISSAVLFAELVSEEVTSAIQKVTSGGLLTEKKTSWS
jgi:hypothetical protein